MENKRGTTVLLTVIGIATLLVAVVGATFAYFTATVTPENADANVTITSATLGTITFDHGKTITLGTTDTPAYPGAMASNTFSVKADAQSSVGVDYVVSFDITNNTFGVWDEETSAVIPGPTNVQYLVCATLSDGSDTVLAENTPLCSTVLTDGKPNENAAWQTIDSSVSSYTLATAKLGTAGAQDSWTLFIRLNETGEAQNHDQGQTFTGALSIDAVSVGYTTGEDGNVANVVTTEIAS